MVCLKAIIRRNLETRYTLRRNDSAQHRIFMISKKAVLQSNHRKQHSIDPAQSLSIVMLALKPCSFSQECSSTLYSCSKASLPNHHAVLNPPLKYQRKKRSKKTSSLITKIINETNCNWSLLSYIHFLAKLIHKTNDFLTGLHQQMSKSDLLDMFLGYTSAQCNYLSLQPEDRSLNT